LLVENSLHNYWQVFSTSNQGFRENLLLFRFALSAIHLLLEIAKYFMLQTKQT